MPRFYPVEIRRYVVQKKRQGYSWDQVAEMVKTEFSLNSAPSRRQMSKWTKVSSDIHSEIVRLESGGTVELTLTAINFLSLSPQEGEWLLRMVNQFRAYREKEKGGLQQ